MSTLIKSLGIKDTWFSKLEIWTNVTFLNKCQFKHLTKRDPKISIKMAKVQLNWPYIFNI